ncbi:MAG: DUF885 domain-containing protein, partial [Wenzhouxiangella sp.]
MSLRKFLVILISGLFLSACGDPAPYQAGEAESSTPASESVADAVGEEERVARLDALYEQYFEDSLALNPLRATFMGDHRWSDRWPNSLGEEHRAEALALQQDYLARLREIGSEGLEGQNLLSYRMFESDRLRSIEGAEYPDHLMPINQFRNPVNTLVMLGSGTGAQPFGTIEDYDNWRRRASEWVVWADQAIVNMREGIERDLVQPRILIERTLEQLDNHLVDDPTESLLYRPVAEFPDDLDPDELERISSEYQSLIADTLMPAIQRLRDFLAGDYLAASRETAGMHALPGGEEWYARLVANTTTTDLTPA